MSDSRVTRITPIVGNGHVKLYELEYLNKEGKQKNWVMASRNDKDTVTNNLINHEKCKPDAVIINARVHGRMVVISEFRPTINGRIYSLPAGIIDADESIEEAAKRELYEETGLTIKNITSISPQIYSSVGMTDENVVIVDCIAEGNISYYNQTDTEDIQVLLLDKDGVDYVINKDNDTKLGARAYFLMREFLRGSIDK